MASSTPFLGLMMICCISFLKSASGTIKFISKLNQKSMKSHSKLGWPHRHPIKSTLSALKCPPAFCVHSASKQIVLSIFSQHKNISGMITERHNVAWLIMKAISKGSLAGC